ncbi:MAG TPA: ABC transporter ATP-binding protein, partial [Pseudomonas sp.]|nr:ABC transporter ATP-binding protein [Pseudomonas sp.]
LRLAADGQLPVISDVAERLGSDTYCHMVTEAEEPLTVRVPGDCAVGYGERQRLALDVDFCHLFDEQGRAVAPLLRKAA